MRRRLRAGAIVGVAAGVACGSGSTGPSASSVARVVITPAAAAVAAGDSLVLAGQAQDSAGRPVAGVRLFWSSNDVSVAVVTQQGVVHAITNGSARIAASAENESGNATVTVRPPLVHSVTVSPTPDTIWASVPGNSVTLTAVTRDAAGAVLTGQPVIWSTANGLVTVDDGTVTATNVAAGSAVVVATSPDSGLPSGSATIVVNGHTRSVALTPTQALLAPGGLGGLPQTVQLTATVTDQFGSDVSAQRAVRWTSSDTAVASVSRTGLVTARAAAAQPATISATTVDGVAGTSSVTVVP
jgi:uncharacterized protein YjdB